MQGPYVPGTCGNAVPPSQWDWENKRLVRGRRYRVASAFADADGDQHDVGEEWTFLASAFSRYDDELILCVELSPGAEWKIPLIWTPQGQMEVIENFLQYVAAA